MAMYVQVCAHFEWPIKEFFKTKLTINNLSCNGFFSVSTESNYMCTIDNCKTYYRISTVI